jgi:hypothetical protein
MKSTITKFDGEDFYSLNNFSKEKKILLLLRFKSIYEINFTRK